MREKSCFLADTVVIPDFIDIEETFLDEYATSVRDNGTAPMSIYRIYIMGSSCRKWAMVVEILPRIVSHLRWFS